MTCTANNIALDILIANGLNITTKGWNGDTILHFAIRHLRGYDEIFQYFITKGGKSLVNARNDEGYTPLHVAADKNDGGYNKVAAKILLKNHADVNIHSHFGNTPLFIAIVNGKIISKKIYSKNVIL